MHIGFNKVQMSQHLETRDGLFNPYPGIVRQEEKNNLKAMQTVGLLNLLKLPPLSKVLSKPTKILEKELSSPISLPLKGTLGCSPSISQYETWSTFCEEAGNPPIYLSY